MTPHEKLTPAILAEIRQIERFRSHERRVRGSVGASWLPPSVSALATAAMQQCIAAVDAVQRGVAWVAEAQRTCIQNALRLAALAQEAIAKGARDRAELLFELADRAGKAAIDVATDAHTAAMRLLGLPDDWGPDDLLFYALVAGAVVLTVGAGTGIAVAYSPAGANLTAAPAIFASGAARPMGQGLGSFLGSIGQSQLEIAKAAPKLIPSVTMGK